MDQMYNRLSCRDSAGFPGVLISLHQLNLVALPVIVVVAHVGNQWPTKHRISFFNLVVCRVVGERVQRNGEIDFRKRHR